MPVVVNVPDANNNQIPAIADVGNAAEINNNQNYLGSWRRYRLVRLPDGSWLRIGRLVRINYRD